MASLLPGRVRPDAAAFARLAAAGNLVPVVWEGLADLETPITLFAKLRRLGACALLESAEQDGRVGRYSFIALRPFARMEADASGLRVTADRPAGAAVPPASPAQPSPLLSAPPTTDLPANPLLALSALMRGFRPAVDPDLGDLPPFWGGAVGFFGYELIHHLERIPRLPDDRSGWPDAAFVFPECVLAVDHFRHRLLVVCNARVGADPHAAYAAALDQLGTVAAALAAPLPEQPQVSLPPPGPTTGTSNMTPRQHAAMVAAAREHIRVGDIFQVVLGQRLSRPFGGDPLLVYRVLRSLNPSPYMFFLDFGGYQLVGASPEMLVRVQGRVVETRPIAGSRPRGQDAAADAALEAELRADPKEIAEHVMLVDLGRNDIGRVAVPGTVEVPEQLAVERFSHVMHLVSSVRGVLRPEHDAFSALAACFPAGTLSGAPKVRAMEIIAALEPHRRGPYGGCVAYFGYDGNMDTAICIRTLALKDGVGSVQAGGGIVADSVAEREYEESINKASAVLRALEAVGAMDAPEGGKGGRQRSPVAAT